jgi:soluble lytic murein transglycosylase-like protein
MAAGEIVVNLTASSGNFVTEINRAAKEAEKLSRSVERQIKILEQQALYAGKSADEIVKLKLAQKNATGEQMGRAQAAIDTRIKGENAAAVEKTIAALQKEAEWAGKTADAIKLLELARLGATKAQQDTAEAAMKERTALEKQAAIVERLAALKKAASLAGKSENEKLLINLQEEGATPRQLGEARSSLNAKASAENAAAVKKEVEELQKLASQAGKTAEELKLLQLAEDGATAAQLAAAESAQKQATVLTMLADLKKKASLAGLSKKDAALKALTENGATPAEIQEARGFFDEEQHKENQAAIEKEIEALKKLTAQVGLTAEQKKLLEWADRGATQAQLAAIEAEQKQTKALRDQVAVAEQLIEMERAAAEIGLTDNEKQLRAFGRQGATPQQLDKARDIQDIQTQKENAAAIRKVIDAQKERAAQAGKTAETLAREEIASKNATQADLAELSAAQQLQKARENEAAVLRTLADLKERAAAAGLSEKDKKLNELTGQGATPTQIQEARGFFDEAERKDNAALIDKEIDALRKLAAQAGKTAEQKKLLELADLGATQAQLGLSAAAQAQIKALNDQASVTERLLEMEIAAAEVGLSDNEKQLRAFSRQGATPQQLDKARDIQDIQTQKENAAAIRKVIDAQKEKAAQAGKTAETLAREEIASKNATQADLAELSAAQQLQKVRDDEAAVLKKIADLKERAATAGLSEKDKMLRELAGQGATPTQLAEAGQHLDTSKAAADQAALTSQAEAFKKAVLGEADAVGKDRIEILELTAAKYGLTQQLAPAIAKIKQAEKGLREFGGNANLSRQQMIFAGVQLKDFFESVLAGQSPMTALLQQGATTVSVFGGFKNTFAAIASVLTPTVIAVTSVAAAIGILTYAAFKGRGEAKELADALTLTGNAAGLTLGSFETFASRIAQSGHRSIGNVKEFALELAKTGEIGPAAFESAVAAAERYGAATGKTAQEVAKDFAQMTRDPLKWAAELNRAYGFVTLAQYEHIRALQEQGRNQEAAAIISKALNTHLSGLDENLGDIQKLLKLGKNLWDEWWDAAKGFGRPETVEDKLKRVREQLATARALKKGQPPEITPENINDPNAKITLGGPTTAADINAFSGKPTVVGASSEPRLEREEEMLSKEAFRKLERATTQAWETQQRKDADAASDFVENMRKRIHAVDQMEKRVAEVKRQIDEYNRAAAKMSPEEQKAKGVRPITDEQRSRMVFETMQETIDPWIAAGIAAKLEASLKDIDRVQQREQNDLAAHNQQLQTLYQAGYTSLSKYYDDRRGVIQASAEIEAGALQKRAEAQQEALEKTPLLTPAEKDRRKSEITDLLAKAAEARRKAGHEIAQSLLEQAIAFRQLTQDMREYQASILQLQGRDFEAAGLRTQNVIERQRELLMKASGLDMPRGPQSTGDFARFDRDPRSLAIVKQEADSKRLLEVQNALNEAQKQQGLITERSANAEQLFMLNATRSGMSLRDQEQELAMLRGQGLMQMEKLYDKYQNLQDSANPDAPINQFLARLRLEIEKLKEAVDPLQERLNALTDSLAGGVASSMSDSLVNVNKLFEKRRDDAKKEADDKRKQYDQDIAQLQTYLARSHDKQEQARLRERIAQKRAARDSIDVSGFKTALKTLERDVVGPILKQVQQTAMKALVTDPLEQELKGMFRGFTKDNIGAIGGGFGGIFGSIGQWIENKFAKPISPKELEAAQASQDKFRESELGATKAVSAAADAQMAAKAAAEVAPTTFADRLQASGEAVSASFDKVSKAADTVAGALARIGDVPAPEIGVGVGAGGDLAAYLDQRAEELGIPKSLARALVKQESGGNPNAVSPAGARGITQVMPGTMREMGYNPATATPENYADAGLRYLKKNYDEFGRWDLALAGYHAGPGAVRRAGGIPNTSDGLSTTKSYVNSVLKLAGIDKKELLSKFGKDVKDLIAPRFSAKEVQAFEGAKEKFRDIELGKNDDLTKAATAQADAAKKASDSLSTMGTGVDETTKAITSMGSESSIASQIMGLLPQSGASPATYALIQLTGAAQSAAYALAQIAGASAASGGNLFLPGIGTLSGGSPSANVPIFSPDGVWDGGGYTGDGGKYKVAGLVHAGEFVNRKEVVSQPGAREFLERFNQIGMDALHGFADGGFVGSSSPIVPNTATRSWPNPPAETARPLPPITIVNNTGTPAKGRLERRPDGGMNVIMDAIKDEMIADYASGGRLSRAQETTFGTRRAPNLFR